MIIKWTGTGTSIAGSFLVAFGLSLVGYLFFLVGSLSWSIVAMRTKDRALLVLNLVFGVANVVGLYNSIF